MPLSIVKCFFGGGGGGGGGGGEGGKLGGKLPVAKLLATSKEWERGKEVKREREGGGTKLRE